MVTHQCCTKCGSAKIVKNGKSTAGKQQYRCDACGCYRTLGTTQSYTEEDKELILRAYQERASLRGVHRVHGVAITTVLRWLKKKSRDSRHS